MAVSRQKAGPDRRRSRKRSPRCVLSRQGRVLPGIQRFGLALDRPSLKSTRHGRTHSLHTTPHQNRRSKGSYVRFHDDAQRDDDAKRDDGGGGGLSTPDGAPLSSSYSAVFGRRSRMGSLDNGRMPPAPPSLASGSSQSRLKRHNSQSTILDPEDINSLLSRCGHLRVNVNVKSRPACA